MPNAPGPAGAETPATTDTTDTAPSADTASAFGDGPADGVAVVLDRREGPHGEVVLRRQGSSLQIIANGCFLMDTSDGRSERLLVRATLEELSRRPAPGTPGGHSRGAAPERPALLLGGLGVGFSLTEATADPRWGRIEVVEREAAILDWHRSGPLSRLSGEALADPRTRLVHAGLLDHLRDSPRCWDALCLDIDNGPGWTVTDDNGSLYTPAGLAACRERLAPGGVLAVWSAQPSPAFEDTLRHAGFVRVRTEEITVVRGVPDVVHFARKPA